jgi:hypothetical protein
VRFVRYDGRVRWTLAAALVALTPGTAAADDGDEHHGVEGYVSVPVTLGVTSRDDGRVDWGFRPEILFAPHGTGLAFGPYAQMGRNSADWLVGTGLTATYYRGENKLLNVSPSLGLYHRYSDPTETGIAASLFVGIRTADGGGGLDLPVGFRVDYRSDGHDRNEVVFSLEADLMWGMVAALLSQLTYVHN